MLMNKNEAGAVSGAMILTIVLTLLVLLFGSVMIWALVNYNDAKNNLDAKVEVAVAEAKKVQSEADEKKFIEREKEPLQPFVSPDDLGGVTFNYPKTWSAYIDKSSNGSFEAYLQPKVVHPLTARQPYALRVTIETRPYDQILNSYASQVKKGDLRSTPVTVNGFSGNRLDGKFSKDINGAMVLFKVRDKTLRVYTESQSYLNDFNTIILKDLKFNP